MKPDWKQVRDDKDIVYEKWDGIAKITINRPEVRNAFRPQTLFEMSSAFNDAREDPSVGVVILTGAGDQAFCSGGDQRVRGKEGYVGSDGVPRLNVLDLQKQIRSLPKPVVAMVAGYAIGGGHVLHVVCDLTIAADNARFGQTGPKVGSFDGGFGASYLARDRRSEEGPGDLVPLPSVRRAAGAGDGPGEHGGAARRAGGRDASAGAGRCCS